MFGNRSAFMVPIESRRTEPREPVSSARGRISPKAEGTGCVGKEDRDWETREGFSTSMNVTTKQERIAYWARTNPKDVFVSVGHHLNPEWLKMAHQRTRKDGAVGVDGVTAEEYAEDLERNLNDLSERVQEGTYQAPPVKRGYVPKPGQQEARPIGMPGFEDKVLQRGVTMILEPIYEQDFLNCSYGFRPKRSAHQALEALWQAIQSMNGCWIVDVDIRKFFDTLDHRHLREILDRRIRDGVIRRLIDKWLKAGVWEKGTVSYPEQGTPQGGCISPMLSNIYLNTVLDEWFEQEVKPRLGGRAFLIRFADDFVMGFEKERDARRVLGVLPKRFGRYGLTVHPDKTRLVDFRNPRQHQGRTSFQFLGFTHYWGKSRRGIPVVKRKTAKERLARTFQRLEEWCRKNRHLPMKDQHRALNQKLRGHYNYYGITGNYRALGQVLEQLHRIWFRWLRRRTRGGRGMDWPRFGELIRSTFPLAMPRVVHSYA
jgi:RNA-directed DNA polymerase